MNYLENVDVDEVSPVRRAANRRRVVLKSGEGEMSVDEEIQDVMSVPWEHEGAMVDRLRKEGADETVMRAAVGAIRLLKGVEDDLPDGVREIVEKLGAEMYPVRNLPLNSTTTEPNDPENELIGSDSVGGSLPTWKGDDDIDEDGVQKDASKPYGDVTYADPGYQKDGTKRYPLDTEAHIRAAWSYINMPKNAAKYDSGQVASIKGRIKSAMKRIGANVSKEDGTGLDVDGALALLKKAFRRNRSQDTRSTPVAEDDGDDTEPDDDPDDIQKEGGTVETPAVPVRKEDGTWDLDGVPEEQRATIAVLLKAQDEQAAELKDARERLAKSEEDRATAEFIHKAETEFDSLAPAGKLGPILKEAAEKLDEETFTAFQEVLKGANARIETGDLFSELGRAALEDGSERTDPWSQIEKKADELVEKADDGLTREQAITRVLKTAEGGKLYGRYQAETYHQGAGNLTGMGGN